MKRFFPILLWVFALGCMSDETTNTDTRTDTTVNTDPVPNEGNVPDVVDVREPSVATTPDTTTARVYANKRFKDVTIKKTGDHKYQITGKGQIFEASFNWVVEDGHEEIAQGHEMTDAGAPEWGDFSFTIDVAKKRPASTLTLIIYEISAKDGSRQHELPIPLY